eukprot:scaffold383831_cov44-Prasinocladus_malaysianus.AAC.1
MAWCPLRALSGRGWSDVVASVWHTHAAADGHPTLYCSRCEILLHRAHQGELGKRCGGTLAPISHTCIVARNISSSWTVYGLLR